jgi:hypothetical protein
MIDDLDNTLKRLLAREVAELADEGHICFERPDDQFQPAQPGVDLFLYDVRENHELRDNEWLVEPHPAAGTVATRQAPIRVDCSYLITAWAGDTASEHRLLGRVMRVLLRYPTLPEDLLPAGLKVQELALPASILQPGSLQSMGEFWQAMGGKPRAALNYTVTIAVAPDEEAAEAPLVFERIIAMKPDVVSH